MRYEDIKLRPMSEDYYSEQVCRNCIYLSGQNCIRYPKHEPIRNDFTHVCGEFKSVIYKEQTND